MQFQLNFVKNAQQEKSRAIIKISLNVENWLPHEWSIIKLGWMQNYMFYMHTQDSPMRRWWKRNEKQQEMYVICRITFTSFAASDSVHKPPLCRFSFKSHIFKNEIQIYASLDMKSFWLKMVTISIFLEMQNDKSERKFRK